MRIQTSSWGELEISEEQIYHFSRGLPGFDEETTFALISLEDGAFSCLQSLNEHELAFLLVDPFEYYASYEFELPSVDMEELEVSEQVILVRCMISLKESLEDSTINLLAPIILNPEKRVAKQIVLHNSAYQTKHALWMKEPSVLSVKEGE
ncbi:flagellar assembly factor FliW [Paenibacillus shirakamiensis]|uniref:Flagellar assembly factor FliW n=1 Tax=Paenibacillus shirakamiensis TaxID=1265935 RepID=A0ABS4JLD2_9BACL|nr:flagellar assembly factor FliW [Paenibacillus shirakamiensis]